MNKHLHFLLACFATVFFACNPPAQPPVKPAPIAQGPSTQDLLDALQGRWQNEQDSTNIIEINDDLITYYQNGREQASHGIEVYNDCPTTVCGVDSLKASEGWCFVEKNDRETTGCVQVLDCGPATLRFQVLGGNGSVRSFKKI